MGVRKFGPFIYQNRTIHILSFFKKRGFIIYLAALKKGAIRHAHAYYVTYRELPPSPLGLQAYARNIYNGSDQNLGIQSYFIALHKKIILTVDLRTRDKYQTLMNWPRGLHLISARCSFMELQLAQGPNSKIRVFV